MATLVLQDKTSIIQMFCSDMKSSCQAWKFQAIIGRGNRIEGSAGIFGHDLKDGHDHDLKDGKCKYCGAHGAGCRICGHEHNASGAVCGFCRQRIRENRSTRHVMGW